MNPIFKTMSIQNIIKILEYRIDNDRCEGGCDEKPPYIECLGCNAAGVLNNIGEILRMDAL